MEISENQPTVVTAHGAGIRTQDGIKNVTILCCHCGTSFSASTTGTNICMKCLSSQVDITGGITKDGILEFCKKCGRYLRPPWVYAELESKALLDICLKKIRGLNKVKLIDANFIWTEPHSRRVKVKLTIQKEVMNNVNIQQSFPVEFVVNYLQCEDCKKEFTPHKWRATVQVRQKVDHKKTFFFLEQLILKQRIHEKMINVEEVNGGIDFFFKERGHAMKLVEFLQGILPVRVKSSKQLISHSEQNSTYNYKYSFAIDIPRVCRDDLVLLKPKLANALGGCSKLLLCTKVASVIQFVDLTSMKIIEMSGAQYFQNEQEIMVIPSKGNLTEFMVFDVELPESKNQSVSFIHTKFKASTATIGRVSDWENFEVKTHLGDVLNDGSTIMAYDLTTLNLTSNFDEAAQLGNFPDIIIVRKVYPEKKKNKKRIWKLKHIEKQERGANNIHKANVQKDRDDKDYEEFLTQLETDPEMRAHINLYKDEKTIKDLETQPNANEVSQSEGHSEVAPESKKEARVNKKKLRAKAKGKKGAKKHSEEEPTEEIVEKEEQKVSEEQGAAKKEKDPRDIKIEELLNDLNLEDDTVKVGAKVNEDEDNDEHDDIEEVQGSENADNVKK